MENNAQKTGNVKLSFGKAAFFVMGVILLSSLLGARGNNGISLGPYGFYTVLTGSMSPTFNAGSVIITKKTKAGTLQAGDILTYAPFGDDVLVTHRIVEVIHDDADYSYITKGDANNVNDLRPVPHENTVGRVIFWVNGLGNVLLFIRTPRGMLLVAVYVLLLLLLSSLFDMLNKHATKEMEQAEPEKDAQLEER